MTLNARPCDDLLMSTNSAQSRIAAAIEEPCAPCDYTDNGWCPCDCHFPVGSAGEEQ